MRRFVLKGFLLAVALSLVIASPPQKAEAGLFGKLFGCCKKEEPTCCEPEPEPCCCEAEPAPEPCCCEPTPCCCESAPEPTPCCCEPAPEPAPCCAFNNTIPLPELAEGEILISISPVLVSAETQNSPVELQIEIAAK